ncbi:MAG: radical SAM protein [Proteobacteria bacterium]|nr:radical SAM protein [Pseudomonadota bacterium]MBU1689063.1 radical SAM protein [Pseudomonadota bacterium]
MKIHTIRGLGKVLFNIRVKLTVFVYFLPELLRGKISLSHFYRFLRRLLFFMKAMQHNKFVCIGGRSRIDLYVPGFPSSAFYSSCRKFMTFNEKLPCTTVLMSVTAGCIFKCKHCYQKFDRLAGADVDIDKLVDVARWLQDRGVAFFNIEGGEPFMAYKRLKKLCMAIDDRSEIWINSTGYQISVERLKELKKLGVNAVMFSLHSPEPEELNIFMGNENAWDIMTKGVASCHAADMPVALNSCLLKNDYSNGRFEQVMEHALKLGAVIVQLIKPKPAGGWLESGADRFSDQDLDFVKTKINLYNNSPSHRHYPAISAQIIEEDKAVFGCTAGGTDRFYINSKGDVQPCEFLNISFGNIASDDFAEIYGTMRQVFAKPGTSWLCEHYSGDILKLFRESNAKALPLSPELSKKVYEDWQHGVQTELYKRLAQM